MYTLYYPKRGNAALKQSEDGWANIGAEIGNKEVLGEREK